MRRKSAALSALPVLALPFVLAGCDDYHDDYEKTNVIGIVLLGGNPVAGAQVQIIFDGFIEDTEVTASDGTFLFEDYPEHWDPFFVEAFYIDPVTLNEYFGVTPFFLTNDSGPTDVGIIVLVQVFPATEGTTQNADQGNLDGDGIDDIALASTEWLGVWLSSGGTRVLGGAGDDGLFGRVTIEDIDGDGCMDVAVDRPLEGLVEVHRGDGRGGFEKE